MVMGFFKVAAMKVACALLARPRLDSLILSLFHAGLPHCLMRGTHLHCCRAQMADLMVNLIQTFNPVHLERLPLRAIYMRACQNLLNIYRCLSGPCIVM